MNIDQFVAAFTLAPTRSGFVIDFDGTLSGIVAEPQAAGLVPGARSVLEKLAAAYAVVAIVSGRQATDVRARVGVESLRYVGLHGAEEWTGAGLSRPAEAATWESTAADLALRATEFLSAPALKGCKVELKGLAVSIHFRGATHAGAQQDIWTWANEAVPDTGFRAVSGRKVVELRPLGTSKAGAVERIVADHDLQNLLVAGDDLTDVEAMEMAARILGANALCVGVRSPEEPAGLVEHANLLVASCDELVEFLAKFVGPA